MVVFINIVANKNGKTAVSLSHITCDLFSILVFKWLEIVFFPAKINEETGEDQDDNITFDDCDVDDDDIDEVCSIQYLFHSAVELFGVHQMCIAQYSECQFYTWQLALMMKSFWRFSMYKNYYEMAQSSSFLNELFCSNWKLAGSRPVSFQFYFGGRGRI